MALVFVALLALGSTVNSTASSASAKTATGNDFFRGDLLSGERLRSGQRIVNPQGISEDRSGSYITEVELLMQQDGDLVFSETKERIGGSKSTTRRTLWTSGTAGNPGAEVVMQRDGNLVIRRGGSVVWQSRTAGQPGAYLRVGRSSISDSGHSPIMLSIALPSGRRSVLHYERRTFLGRPISGTFSGAFG